MKNKSYNVAASLVGRNLACVRGERELFYQLDFMLAPGQLLQIGGPNGSGKTSLLRIIAGLAQEEEGAVRWNDENINQAEDYLDNMMYIGHQPGVKNDLTALENLAFSRKLKNDNERDLFVILQRLSLRGFEDVPCANLSAGQKRRVALSRLFACDCQLWILDEPFTALDKEGVARLEEDFAEHLGKAGMIMLTTHQPLTSLSAQKNIINPLDFCR